MRAAIHVLLLAGSLTLLVGCDRLWPDVHWRSERYVLTEIDAREQMSLGFDQQNGTTMGLVGPTVFSIGGNEKYIVLMQHPSTNAFAAFDRSITNYFVVERTSSPDFAERQKGVRGPLTRAEFEKLAVSLSLPKFTKTFNDLK